MKRVTAYILRCSDNSYHFGLTTTLEERIQYHQKGQHEATSNKLPVVLHFKHEFDNVLDASSFQLALKQLSDKEIAVLEDSNWVKEKIQEISLQRNSISPRIDQIVALPTSYIPPISYFRHLLAADELHIITNELFQKQTYRNRSTILAANGLQNLIVPIERPNGKLSKTNEVLISYAENWQKNQIKTLESAYRKTPYFEYYASDLFEILSKKYDRLIDLNLVLLRFFCEKLNAGILIKNVDSEDALHFSLKNELLPKNRQNFIVPAYHQAFNSTDEFEPNLSILDLLFNEGPNSVAFIKKVEAQPPL